MKGFKVFILPSLLIVVMAFMGISCSFKKGASKDTKTTSEKMKTIDVDVATVDSLVFIPLEGEPIRMEPSDCKLLSGYLSRAEYDTKLNSGDIMIKMQAPDYTVVFYYKGKSSDQNDWLMVWNENGRTKFADEWYYLSENTRSDVYKLLGKHVK